MSVTLKAARDAMMARTSSTEPFSWPDVGEHFNWAHDWFDPFARGCNKTGLVLVDRSGQIARHTFAELVTGSDRVASYLAARGVRRGDAVVVMLGNQIELWLTMLALIKLGAVVIPTTAAVTADELQDRVERGNANVVVCNPVDEERLVALERSLIIATTDDLQRTVDLTATPVPHPGNRSDDPLLLYFTSGTTSRPKLVVHTHVSFPVGHLTTMHWLGLRPGDVHLNISAPGWAKHAYSMFFAPWLAQATVIAFDYERFDASELLDVLQEQEVTTFCAPPTVWRMLIKADLSRGPGSLRELMSAGEPLNAEVVEQVRDAWALTIRDGYGQTETTLLVGNTPGLTVKPGSMGRPLLPQTIVLIDPATGRPHPTEGEVCVDLTVAPVNVMSGYQDDSGRHVQAMADGYYRTGDLACRDEDGYITFIGRMDDVFKSSDYKVSPFELESVLIEHPAVLEAAVVPSPDPLRLAVPKAFVSIAPGHAADQATAEDIFRYIRLHLPPYQRIRKLEFIELPKTSSGKIRRTELRDRECATPSPSPREFVDQGSGAPRSGRDADGA
jgi:acetyl-CoA synthetase